MELLLCCVHDMYDVSYFADFPRKVADSRSPAR